MKALAIATHLALALLLTGSLGSCATDDSFDNGLTAFKRKDYALAMKLWRPIADKGDPMAQFYIGQIYEEEDPPNEAEAAKWFELAANNGKPEAAFRLALIYEGGKGTAKDDAQAAKWYLRSALGQHGLAQYFLARYYSEGRGVARDSVRAYMWASLAAYSLRHVGYAPDANRAAVDFVAKMYTEGDADLIKSLQDRLTLDQIDQGHAMAEKCQDSHFKQCD